VKESIPKDIGKRADRGNWPNGKSSRRFALRSLPAILSHPLSETTAGPTAVGRTRDGSRMSVSLRSGGPKGLMTARGVGARTLTLDGFGNAGVWSGYSLACILECPARIRPRGLDLVGAGSFRRIANRRLSRADAVGSTPLPGATRDRMYARGGPQPARWPSAQCRETACRRAIRPCPDAIAPFSVRSYPSSGVGRSTGPLRSTHDRLGCEEAS
jgi:hypothetical protein